MAIPQKAIAMAKLTNGTKLRNIDAIKPIQLK
jgi:hypothetical protein